jgi:hypothetical protein
LSRLGVFGTLHLVKGKKLKLVGLGTIVVGLIAAFVFFVVGYFKPKVAGIYIETNPSATVFINDVQVGRTPYKGTRKPGEMILKLVPESFEAPLAPYEAKINLVVGVETVVRRDFGESVETSSGEVISFEKIEKDQISLAVVSIPDSVQLTIDGYLKSITPHKDSSVSPGEHTLSLSAKGYLDKTVRVKTYVGYKLTAVIQLALDNESAEGLSEELPSPDEVAEDIKEEKKPQVRILETSVGFLRVRDEPSTLGEEIGRVEPGDVFNLLDMDEKTGWFEIEYEESGEDLPTKTGWISNQYAEKIENEKDDTSPTATPTAKATIAP